MLCYPGISNMLKKFTENLTRKAKIVHQNCSRRLIATTTTIDNEEVHHFKQYSSTWWDEMGEMKPLHSMNLLRVPFIRDNLINMGTAKSDYIDSSEPLTDLQILDVGCGGGLLSEPLARLGCKVVGIDATTDLIDIAKEHAATDKSLSNLTYLTSSIEEYSSKNSGIFDAVVASEVIEHVNDKTKFLSECVKCLKPGGSIIVTTVNKTFLSRILAIYVVQDILQFIPEKTHQYEKFIEPHVLQRLLEESNCQTTMIHGMFYNYLTNNWSWISDTSICYALHAVKMQH